MHKLKLDFKDDCYFNLQTLIINNLNACDIGLMSVYDREKVTEKLQDRLPYNVEIKPHYSRKSFDYSEFTSKMMKPKDGKCTATI